MISENVTSTDPAFGTLLDVDVGTDGEWVGLFERDGVVTIRDASRARAVPVPLYCTPRIRRLDATRVVVVEAWAYERQPNAWIIDWNGSEVTSFHAGSGVQDVLARGDRIVVTYFDEGVFKCPPPSDEGLAVFDDEGRLRAGYHSALGAASVGIADCYAACWLDGRRIAFCAYTEFHFVTLDVDTCEQVVHPTPRRLHSPGALSTAGATAFFHVANTLYSWVPAARDEQPVAVGLHPGPLRGLGAGRFLTHGADSFTTLELQGDPTG